MAKFRASLISLLTLILPASFAFEDVKVPDEVINIFFIMFNKKFETVDGIFLTILIFILFLVVMYGALKKTKLFEHGYGAASDTVSATIAIVLALIAIRYTPLVYYFILAMGSALLAMVYTLYVLYKTAKEGFGFSDRITMTFVGAGLIMFGYLVYSMSATLAAGGIIVPTWAPYVFGAAVIFGVLILLYTGVSALTGISYRGFYGLRPVIKSDKDIIKYTNREFTDLKREERKILTEEKLNKKAEALVKKAIDDINNAKYKDAKKKITGLRKLYEKQQKKCNKFFKNAQDLLKFAYGTRSSLKSEYQSKLNTHITELENLVTNYEKRLEKLQEEQIGYLKKLEALLREAFTNLQSRNYAKAKSALEIAFEYTKRLITEDFEGYKVIQFLEKDLIKETTEEHLKMRVEEEIASIFNEINKRYNIIYKLCEKNKLDIRKIKGLSPAGHWIKSAEERIQERKYKLAAECLLSGIKMFKETIESKSFEDLPSKIKKALQKHIIKLIKEEEKIEQYLTTL